MANIIKPIFLLQNSQSACQNIYNDSPIKRYKIVQTTPNTHEGGEKRGFDSSEYQPFASIAQKLVIAGKYAINIDKTNFNI